MRNDSVNIRNTAQRAFTWPVRLRVVAGETEVFGGCMHDAGAILAVPAWYLDIVAHPTTGERGIRARLDDGTFVDADALVRREPSAADRRIAELEREVAGLRAELATARAPKPKTERPKIGNAKSDEGDKPDPKT